MALRMKTLALALAALAAGVSEVRADWQFRSRPDLAPPRLNVTTAATNDSSPGYLFVAPYNGPEQPAAYILRDNGDLVWSGLGYFAGWVGNLQVAHYGGETVLQAFQGSLDASHGRGWGTPLLLGQDYRPRVQVRGLSDKLPSIHELRIVNEKSVLLEIYQPQPHDLTPYGGTADQQWIVDGVFQEVDIATGELLFEGHSLDFASPDESKISIGASSGLSAKDGWDYFHLNSIDKDDQGNYLVSSRHTHTLYKISGRDGAVIWRLGGQKSTFSFDDDVRFAYQHDARFLSRSDDGQVEVISLFDNAADKIEQLRPQSRALVVRLNHTAQSATAVQAYGAPDGISAQSQGNAQVLDNGNVFVNWGSAGAVTEFRADGTPTFHAYLDSGAGVQNYRGFRFPWTGHASEVPAIVALRHRDEATVYVSWNGDTEVRVWRFYAQPVAVLPRDRAVDVARATQLGEAQRTSFETTLTVATGRLARRAVVFAQGLDAEGNVLTTTRAVAIQEAVEPAHDTRPEDPSGDGEL